MFLRLFSREVKKTEIKVNDYVNWSPQGIVQ